MRILLAMHETRATTSHAGSLEASFCLIFVAPASFSFPYLYLSFASSYYEFKNVLCGYECPLIVRLLFETALFAATYRSTSVEIDAEASLDLFEQLPACERGFRPQPFLPLIPDLSASTSAI